MPDLETVDLAAVEIMAAGERVRGKGSPAEGEVYQAADLERIAQETNEVLDLVQPWAHVDTNPIGFQKAGHNDEQAFLKASGFYQDDRPATGWLHNLRVQDGKLVSDIKDVPKSFADLIKAKAFRRRSPELYEHTSTVDGKKRTVVGALAWLGARRPAFQTLGDVVALYADGGVDEDTVKLVDIPEAPHPPGPADTHRRMPDQPNPLRSFAEAVGLDGEPSEDQILERLRGLVTEADAAKKRAESAEGKATEYAEQIQALEPRIKAGENAAEELRVTKRERLFEEVIREKRVPPAELEGEAGEQLRKDYDASPDVVERMLRGRQPRTDLERQFGADPAPTDAEQQQAEGLALFPDPSKAA